MNVNDDPYQILGVPSGALDDEIKKAYRKLALIHHPDRQQSDHDKEKAHDEFAKISEAYNIVMDPVKRFDWKQRQRTAQYNGNRQTTKTGGGMESSKTAKTPSGGESTIKKKHSKSSKISSSPKKGGQTPSRTLSWTRNVSNNSKATSKGTSSASKKKPVASTPKTTVTKTASYIPFCGIKSSTPGNNKTPSIRTTNTAKATKKTVGSSFSVDGCNSPSRTNAISSTKSRTSPISPTERTTTSTCNKNLQTNATAAATATQWHHMSPAQAPRRVLSSSPYSKPCDSTCSLNGSKHRPLERTFSTPVSSSAGSRSPMSKGKIHEVVSSLLKSTSVHSTTCSPRGIDRMPLEPTTPQPSSVYNSVVTKKTRDGRLASPSPRKYTTNNGGERDVSTTPKSSSARRSTARDMMDDAPSSVFYAPLKDSPSKKKKVLPIHPPLTKPGDSSPRRSGSKRRSTGRTRENIHDDNVSVLSTKTSPPTTSRRLTGSQLLPKHPPMERGRSSSSSYDPYAKPRSSSLGPVPLLSSLSLSSSRRIRSTSVSQRKGLSKNNGPGKKNGTTGGGGFDDNSSVSSRWTTATGVSPKKMYSKRSISSPSRRIKGDGSDPLNRSQSKNKNIGSCSNHDINHEDCAKKTATKTVGVTTDNISSSGGSKVPDRTVGLNRSSSLGRLIGRVRKGGDGATSKMTIATAGTTTADGEGNSTTSGRRGQPRPLTRSSSLGRLASKLRGGHTISKENFME